MSGWRQLAESIRQSGGGGTIGTIGTKPPADPSIVPIVPIVPGVSIEPAKVLKEWREGLSCLDVHAVPEGIDRHDWWQKCDDAFWIYNNFAPRAVRDGWSANDLFGVMPIRPGWGGLCDRLRGARNLKMAGQKAIWSRWGVPDWSCAGSGDALVGSGLLPIWELGK